MDEIVKELFEMLKAEREENARLTRIMLQHLGVSVTEGDTTVHVNGSVIEKIPLGKSANWLRIKAEYEKKYRRAAEETSKEISEEQTNLP